MSTDYDLDPAALAWARTKIQRHIDQLTKWEQQATEQGKTEQAAQWRRMAWYLRRKFIGGQGCVVTAFDERLPALRASIDAARPGGAA